MMTKQSVPHEQLGFWIGTWKIEAKAKETPLWPAGEYHATMTAEWFEGEFHVICRYKWTGAMGAYSGLEILGYDPGNSEYYNFSIDGFGSGLVFKGTAKESVWTYIAEKKAEGKTIKFRWTVKDESPGLITWKSQSPPSALYAVKILCVFEKGRGKIYYSPWVSRRSKFELPCLLLDMID